MPGSRNAHQAQLFATPPPRTKLVTKFGVSVLNVVATIDTPISHHGAARPDVKNSLVLRPARLTSQIAGTNEMTIETRTMTQSIVVGFMPSARPRVSGLRMVPGEHRARFPREAGGVYDRCRETMGSSPRTGAARLEAAQMPAARR